MRRIRNKSGSEVDFLWIKLGFLFFGLNFVEFGSHWVETERSAQAGEGGELWTTLKVDFRPTTMMMMAVVPLREKKKEA